MLRLWWGCMLVLLQLFDDVARHGNVKGVPVVILLEVYAAVAVAVLIFGEFIFFLDAFDEVVDVLLARIFHAETVDDKCAGD
jgi:hypothetical protein